MEIMGQSACAQPSLVETEEIQLYSRAAGAGGVMPSH